MAPRFRRIIASALLTANLPYAILGALLLLSLLSRLLLLLR
jgi:hypothetical protein